MFDVLSIGDTTLDALFTLHDASLHCRVNSKDCELGLKFGAKIPITQAAQSLGGNAANVAVGLSRLDKKVALYTEVGDDLTGDIIKQELGEAGISDELICVRAGLMSRYSVVLNFKNERTILAYHPKHTYEPPALPPARWVYYTSLGAGFTRVQSALAQYIKQNPDTKLACNPGSHQLETGIDTLKKILDRVNFLVLNREEATQLVGRRAPIAKLLTALHRCGPETVVITDGNAGAYGLHNDTAYSMPIFPTNAISKTGAGDAFATGCLAALMDDQPLATALRWGAANAASVVEELGAQIALCTNPKLQRLLRRFADITASPLRT